MAAVCTTVFFSPAIAHGRLLAIGDGLIEALPGFLAPNERWQPAMLGGFPIYADPSKAFWNPLRLLRFIPNGFNLYVMAGYTVAAWATYGYVRNLTGHAAAGIASAVTFTCGAFLVSHFGQPMIVQPAAWACVTLWSVAEYVRTKRGLALVASAVSEVLMLVSGQPQVAAFTVVVSLTYLL